MVDTATVHRLRQVHATPATVLASATTGVLDLIDRNKGDADRILGEVRLRPQDIADPYSELILAQFCKLFEAAAQLTGNDNFGLHFGESFRPQQLGVIGYAAISSPTLYSAVRNMEAFFPAHQGLSSFGLIQDGDMLWLSYAVFDPHIEQRRQDAELSMGMFLNIFRHALGQDWAPLEVRFEHDAPDAPQDHERVFRAPVRFGRRTNAFAFRRQDLDVRMPTQDPYLFSVIEPFLRSRVELTRKPEDFASRVRNQIKLYLGDIPPTICEMAKVFGISDQSFQRELRDSGITFQELVTAARKDLALHYMDDPNMPLTEVADSLGYSELSAFSRAFRGWTGMSPQRYRQSG
jgi:AraC-like DNA-binding protein